MMDEAYARQRTPAGPRPEYIPPNTYWRDAVIPGNPDLRKALEKGPMTRDELARHFQCSRSDVAKPIYRLIRSGEVIEEGDRISLLRRNLPSEPSEEPKCYPSTTPPQKIDSMAVSGAAMGMSGAGCLASLNDLDNACPTEAQLHEHHGCSGSETRPLEKESCANPDEHEQPPHAAEDPHWEIRQEDPNEMAERYRDARIRESIALIMAELPALLEDREKLRKLREVLG